MPTLRSQTASALTEGKILSDISELGEAATVSPNPNPPCLGPGTPAQEQESARVAAPVATPAILRSRRLKVEADTAALADNALGLSRRKAKSVLSSSTDKEGASVFRRSSNILLDQNKGKRKVEEPLKEAFCENIILEDLNAKSGGCSVVQIINSDSQGSQEIPDSSLNPSPGFVTARGSLGVRRAYDPEGLAGTKRGRGKGGCCSRGFDAMTKKGESTSLLVAGDEFKVPLFLDLNESPGGSSSLDEVHEEPNLDRELETGKVSVHVDLNFAVEEDGDVNILAEEYLEEAGEHRVMEDKVSFAVSDLEAGPSHRPYVDAGVQNLGGRGRGRRSRSEASRCRFLQIARDRAFHFAHFDADGDEAPAGAPPPHVARAGNGRQRRQPRQGTQHRAESQPQAQQVDWPGPFSTARQLVNNRAMAAAAHQNAGAPGSRVSLMDWQRTRVPGDPMFSRKKSPSLEDLCLGVLSNNAENVVSLEGVPDLVRLRISGAFCERRKMSSKALSVFFQGEPSDLQSLDCTQISEDELTEMMKQISPSRLEKLHLGNCGRALSEHCLLASIASPSTVTLLKSISFRGAYRLSDQGLEALLLASPQLVHLDLSTCSFLSNASVKAVARCVSGTLESLVLDGCPNLNATVFVHDLVRLPKLQRISLSEVGGVTDEIVSEICVQLGSHLRELVLAHCTSLTDAAIAAIGPCCPSLQVLNLAYLSSLTDVAIAHITDNLRKIQDLNVRRCKFSDAAIATFVTASGGALLNLSLNSVQQVADLTILALATHSHACLECLDLSFCRLVDDECLGFLADACLRLHKLKLYGCTQVTQKFLNGHSNCNLKVVGLTSCV